MYTGSRLTLLVVLLKHAYRTLQNKPLSTTEGRRVALMNLGCLTEIRGDSINSGHMQMVRKAEAIELDGYLQEKTAHAIWWWAVRVQTLWTEPRGPPSSGIVRCQCYHLNPASVILIWAQLCSIPWSGYWLMHTHVIMRIMRKSAWARPQLDTLYLLMTPIESPIAQV